MKKKVKEFYNLGAVAAVLFDLGMWNVVLSEVRMLNGESEYAASPIDIEGIHCAELYRLEPKCKLYRSETNFDTKLFSLPQSWCAWF